ncbi:polyamine ABC transporter ATP-binding protein [Rhizobium leguminosarum]|jgi:putative spermidine/putrescine transport system ATP-binding protein|uniref:Spermidine/putrescine import ATP-binding protein PotA n=2 Tax=Rhizobium TaxID=379 RepID=A0ABU3YJP7_9HYPH|nr:MULTISPECIES: ABC transporter ATP-binding protein [Rhizobium]MDV4179073.1 ABC transporter ATP-binding protein [Rhizobium brockwellii]MDV4186071.1 ABC transporter ATP-binding protein [Rhizobium brockwellii]NEH48316.1 polyamine ABC transporter ATP-binding protein [Rhizobium leguminosarum]NZD48692.1 ABC transporter ATP-binding protein [Rhizobium leguminosarum]QIO52585.1 ABC transporter ATP-binding protein [Rhizobium leguminosarum bv. trifolii]
MSQRADNYIVRFDAVEKTYDGTNIVVKRLNLDIRKGEFLTMLGPSGSGKTTSLMMLAGFEMPTSGTIVLDGKPIEKLPPHRRNIGVVFQNYALFPNMTVAENVAFPLQMRKVSKADQKDQVRAALDMVQMGQFSGRRPAQLSGGQQQRIALARALVFKPSLVLMDEPLGALDKQLREHMQLEIKHLHEKLGISIVYVTHDQSEALTMSDRIAIFNDGVVQQLGSPTDIYENPSNPFVARFIGDNNSLSGNIKSVDGSVCEVHLDGANQVVRARATPSVRAGDRTTLSIRPERIHIDPMNDNHNVAAAVVEEVIYLGDHVRVRVSALGSNDIVIKVPNGSLHSSAVARGKKLSIGWSPTDCAALQ